MPHAPESYPVTEAFRGMRLDHFLQQMLPRMSRTAIQEAIEKRVHLASQTPIKASRRLAVGDVVFVQPRPAASPIPPVLLPIPVLAEGAGWFVIDKPAGLSTTPSAKRPGEDIATRLDAAPAHRLDRFTSGCLLLTRDPTTARHFDLLFRAHAIAKHYLAVIHGSPEHDEFEIEAPIGDATGSRVPGKAAVTETGRPALTCVRVIAREGNRTLVRASPRTGRRHQLRVHLAHAGHAIVGDLLYGEDERQFVRLLMGQPTATPPDLVPGRHLLHAHWLAFAAPGTMAQIEITAPWPSDFGFATAMGSWRAGMGD
jgi:23S rRNA pseudouridine1911/1915/1917 synthase